MSKTFTLSLKETLDCIHPLQAINIERPQHFACFSKVQREVKFGADAGRPPTYVPQHPPLNLNDVSPPPSPISMRPYCPELAPRCTPAVTLRCVAGAVRVRARG
jgi:hypothetical protein